ncbi:MAG TPA: type I glyceraldehyde-3-phosphate dehydrogenase [Acidimicrobiales bacterium]|nr:type I glyceraldehyde-3-phosphate dehydrogenase [Acidimicrobiales bacterium]
MTVRVGINGFGRIGRNFYRAAKKLGADVELVAVNDPGMSAETSAHLLKYDSTHGVLDTEVKVTGDGISAGNDSFRFFAEREPSKLPWGELGVDVVIESTGVFTDGEKAKAHLEAGAPRVIISAPATNVDGTFVVGVNDDQFESSMKIVSNASCTTNCFVPMIKVLDDAFGVEKGLMTTVHAYTNDQNLLDLAHKDLRRARASAVNIVPSSTGAARATSLVLESMKGRLDGQALRVPVPDGSITDFTGILGREVTGEEVNEAFRAAAGAGPLAKVLVYTEDEIVSSDIVGSSASCTFDSKLTMAMGSMVKVFGWYDNEWGYSCRLVDLTVIVGGAK